MDWPELFGRRALGMRLGLAVVQGAYDALGAPARGIDAIHLVGTNGKGSTAAMAAHALRRRGRRVGLYTSPHLRRVGERVRIDGAPIDDDVLLAHVRAVVAAEPPDAPRPLTFFELLTLAALRAFAAAGVDALVVEAGLGGRLDATRVVSARVVVVTAIGLDHTQWLGDTLEAIAAEKAAVFAPGVPVMAAPAVPAVEAVLRARAAEVGAPLSFPSALPRPPRGLVGPHQAHNAALALAAARVLEPATTASDLDGVDWPGRLQRIAVGPGTLWLDAAHNEEAMAAALAGLDGERVSLDRVVFGCLDDKPQARMRAQLGRLGRPILDVDLGPASAKVAGAVDWETAWRRTRQALAEGETVLVCGSVRLVGMVLAALAGGPSPDAQDPVRAADRADGVFGGGRDGSVD